MLPGEVGMMWWTLQAMVACLLVIMSWIDIKYMKIPNWVVCCLSVPVALSALCQPEIGWVERLAGSACVSIPMGVMSHALPGSFGGGDVKLMAVCGLLLGVQGILLAAWIGVVAGGVVAFALLMSGRQKPGGHMAFGPYLALGIWISLRYGEQVLGWYHGLY